MDILKNSIFGILILFCILTVSANGLTVTSQNETNINKTPDISRYITFTIRNEEPFTFYNISEDSPYIKFNTVPQLSSGENVTITAEIVSNVDFSGIIKIKGFYETQLGVLNDNYTVEVDYLSGGGFGFSECDFSVVQGDRVMWKNIHDTATIAIVNAITQQNAAILQPQMTYTEIFETPTIFGYYLSRYGLPSQICNINVLASQGIINNPVLDGELNLNIKIIHLPTSLSLTLLTTNYTINPGEFVEDIFKITNVGNESAKNIYLNGEWFEFSSNNFVLSPGESRNIGYKITPKITETNETNMSYEKKFNITGNFDVIEELFYIHIPYLKIEGDVFKPATPLRELIDNYIKIAISYCNDNPNDEICDGLFTTMILGVQNTSSGMGGAELTVAFIDFMDSQEEFNNLMKQRQLTDEEKLTSITENTRLSAETSMNIADSMKNYNNGVIFLVMILVFAGVCGIMYYFINFYKKRNFKNKYDRYQ